MSAHSEWNWSPWATAVYLLKLLQLRGSVACADAVLVERYLQELTKAAGRAHNLHTAGSQLQSGGLWRIYCAFQKKKKTRSSFNSLCFPLTLFFTLEATYYLIFFYVSYRGQQLGGFLDHASLIALLRALGKDPRCPSRKWTPTGQSR